MGASCQLSAVGEAEGLRGTDGGQDVGVDLCSRGTWYMFTVLKIHTAIYCGGRIVLKIHTAIYCIEARSYILKIHSYRCNYRGRIETVITDKNHGLVCTFRECCVWLNINTNALHS